MVCLHDTVQFMYCSIYQASSPKASTKVGRYSVLTCVCVQHMLPSATLHISVTDYGNCNSLLVVSKHAVRMSHQTYMRKQQNSRKVHMKNYYRTSTRATITLECPKSTNYTSMFAKTGLICTHEVRNHLLRERSKRNINLKGENWTAKDDFPPHLTEQACPQCCGLCAGLSRKMEDEVGVPGGIRGPSHDRQGRGLLV